MKDLHNHILYGIDDGPENIKDSIAMLKQAEASGYTDLITTPHYRPSEGYVADKEKEEKRINKLRDQAKKENININIHLGCEITLDDDTLYLLDSKQIATLANSRYILIELPFFEQLNNLDELLDGFKERKLIPIIAHPERCHGYSINDYRVLIDKGVLLQGNYESLYSKYGQKAKKRLEKMLKNHMISFIGSDAHNPEHNNFEKIRAVQERLINLTQSIEITEDLINNNIEKILENKMIKPYKRKEQKEKIKEKIDKKTKIYLITKRIFDILISLIGLILLIPFLIIIKLLYLKDKDKNPIIFKQARIGTNGRIFEIYKIRIMVPNADEVLFKYLKENEEIRKEYQNNKKIKNDPRITKIGKIIKKYSLDELPQFINILKGDMSFIGNRPYLPREKKDMNDYYEDIIKTKPGLTGYWQVSSRKDNSFNNRLKKEQYYSNNYSFKLDIIIFFKTFITIFNRRNTK
ncbi:MAG: CpsB/CapC family capsule biosynthesis tyrosine phosphatase [Candidatus Coprovivens sp.]